MRLRSAAMLLAAVLALPLHAATPPTPDAVKSAVEAVYNDPDLHGLKADRTLRFKPDDAPPKAQDAPDLAWLRSLVRWMSETGRWLVWLAGAIAVALLAVYLKRWLALRGDADGARTLALPSHVGDLDIRPDSLPDDIGAAVRALWQRGEARAALSLLYRGALSALQRSLAVETGCIVMILALVAWLGTLEPPASTI